MSNNLYQNNVNLLLPKPLVNGQALINQNNFNIIIRKVLVNEQYPSSPYRNSILQCFSIDGAEMLGAKSFTFPIATKIKEVHFKILMKFIRLENS